MGKYVRKTEDEWVVESYYPGNGWSLETTCTSRGECLQRLKDYRKNDPKGTYRWRKVRVKKETV